MIIQFKPHLKSMLLLNSRHAGMIGRRWRWGQDPVDK